SVVSDFVRWTFDVAERVDGWWPRASLASGRAKDPAFQLDQQLYPLLLVADHARLTGDPSLRDRYAEACRRTLAALLDKRTAFGWGFCPADDPRWRATIAFAWSERNEGYFEGALGGLGSVHTRHPWPLGDLQEIVVARATRDAERERRARERLVRVETWDGML